MADFPDVLDALGKTPREFGSLHVHLEALQPVDGDRYVASVLLQAAFEPMTPARVALLLPTGEVASTVQVPVLEGGRVLRLRAPLRSAVPLTRIGLATECAEPTKRAQRVRPAWKLHETIEVPKLSNMKPAYGDVSIDVSRSLAATALMGGAGFAIAFSGGATLSADTSVKVHAAYALPSVLWVDLTPANAPPISEPEFEVVWAVGQPVPEPPPIVPAAPPLVPSANARRWCRACAWEAPAGEYVDDRRCPNCDEHW